MTPFNMQGLLRNYNAKLFGAPSNPCQVCGVNPCVHIAHWVICFKQSRAATIHYITLHDTHDYYLLAVVFVVFTRVYQKIIYLTLACLTSIFVYAQFSPFPHLLGASGLR
jgi:hypothetical protein